MKTCSVPTCNKKHLAKGYCSTHYKQFARNGKVTESTGPRLCKIEGCNNKHEAQGYCQNHYKKWQRGTLNKPRPSTQCKIPGCNRKRHAQGLCQAHLKRKNKGQSLTAPIRPYASKTPA